MNNQRSKEAKLAELFKNSKSNEYYPQIQQPKDDNDYLSVSFQYLQRDYDLNRKYLTKDNRLQLLKKIVSITHMTWNDLTLQDKKHGFERIDKDIVKNLPNIITDDIQKLYVLRFASQDCRLVGMRQDNIFQILYIDPDLSLYKH